jgi:hypothetical protein
VTPSPMKEATIRDFFLGKATPERLAGEAGSAVEAVRGGHRRVHIQDLPPGAHLTLTPPMLVHLCDAFLAGALPASALETIAFALIASDHLRWSEDDELIGRVLYDLAVPEISWELTPENVRMFRDWLTGAASPPSEPEMTTDSLSGLGYLRRTTKVHAG